MTTPEYRREVLDEVDRIPTEFLPAFLTMIRSFRESVTLPSALESFEQGWQEALDGETRPVAELWNDIGAVSRAR
ncbi:MAG: hypothetical protein AAGI71_02250 [Bacteroidota bacterium]